MVDLDELDAAINRCAFDGDVLGLSKAECRDLLTSLRQAEKDAARYRWLRDKASAFAIENAAEICREAWDSLIDDAIKARNGGDL